MLKSPASLVEMRAVLLPLRTEPRRPRQNLARLKQRLREVAPLKPDLVCLPECTLTGYLYEEADFRRFAQPIPGPAVRQMARLARSCQIWLCFGLLERAEEGVYNTALLIDRQGQIRLRHRKVEEKPPFLTGSEVSFIECELGQMAVLVCGDLFNSSVIASLPPTLDWLIVPMSRSFDGRSPDAARWEAEERQVYLQAVKAAGTAALIVNALEINTPDPAFGGALVVSQRGERLAEAPHGTDEILVWELERLRR